jgi:hypothetical protein
LATRFPVLLIQDVYPETWIPNPNFFHPESQILDPNFVHPGSLITDLNFFHPRSWIPDPHQRIQVFLPKKWFLNSQKYDPGFPSRIRIPDLIPDFLPIPDPDPGSQIPNPGVKKAQDP